MILLSQNRSGNNQIKLGTGSKNTTTIASHGCTITCIGMISGLSERRVNELFIEHGVFAQSGPEIFNLVNWTKISKAIPWLEFEWRNVGYDNDRVSAAIAKNGFCLVEVDFDGSPKTNDKHWIVYKGNKKINDPWDGKEKSTSSYPATGYAIINKIGNPPIQEGNDMANVYKGYNLSDAESMKAAVDVLVDVQNQVYIRTAEATRQLTNATTVLKEQHAREITSINENIDKEKQAAIDKALQEKDTYMRSEIAKALNDQNGSDLDTLLAKKGYKVDNIVIKKN